MTVIYNAAVKTVRETATMDYFANGTLELLSAGDVVLAIFGLDAAGGSVSGAVWTLVFDAATVTGEAGASTGTNATKAQVKTSGGSAHLTGLTVGVGSGDIQLNTVNIVSGEDVTLSSATITHPEMTVYYLLDELGNYLTDELGNRLYYEFGNAVTGTMAATESSTPDTFAAVGTVAVIGAMAATESSAPDVFAGVGTSDVTIPVIGTMAATESSSPDVFVATGTSGGGTPDADEWPLHGSWRSRWKKPRFEGGQEGRIRLLSELDPPLFTPAEVMVEEPPGEEAREEMVEEVFDQPQRDDLQLQHRRQQIIDQIARLVREYEDDEEEFMVM